MLTDSWMIDKQGMTTLVYSLVTCMMQSLEWTGPWCWFQRRQPQTLIKCRGKKRMQRRISCSLLRVHLRFDSSAVSVVRVTEIVLLCLVPLLFPIFQDITRLYFKYVMTTRSWMRLASFIQPMRCMATGMSATVRAVPRKKLASTRSAITIVSTLKVDISFYMMMIDFILFYVLQFRLRVLSIESRNYWKQIQRLLVSRLE